MVFFIFIVFQFSSIFLFENAKVTLNFQITFKRIKKNKV